MDTPADVPLTEYWRILKKRRLTILTVFGLVVAATVVFTALQTPVYEAAIELRIESSVPLGADLKAQAASTAVDRKTDLGTEIRLIKGLNVLARAAEKVEVLPEDPELRRQALHMFSLDYQNRVRVEQIPDTTIIVVKTTADTARKAALLASAVADAYIAENTFGRRHQLESVLKYVDGQLGEYERQIEDIEARLLKFKQDEKVFQVTPAIKANLDRMEVGRTFEFEEEMMTLDAALKTLTATIAEKRAAGALHSPDPDQLSGDYLFTGLRRRLAELEFERFLLLVDYTEKHPAVLEKDKTIGEVKSRMVSMIKAHGGDQFDAAAEADLALVLNQLFMESRREVLYRLINRYYSDEGSLSENQRAYVSMTREQERVMGAYNALQANRDEARLALASVDDRSVSVVSPASAARDPISPKARINYLVSMVAGLILGMMAGFLQESMDTTISTIADVEHRLNLAVLGIIPLMKTEDGVETVEGGGGKVAPKIDMIVTFYEPRSWLSQSFKILRANLLQVMKAGERKVVLVTSSEQQEGKSTVIANVAVAMAQLGKRTLLVELNLRRPTLYKRLGLKREPGMTDVLLGKAAWRDALRTPTDILAGGLDIDRLLKMPGLDNLRVLPAGHSIDNISELLNSSALEAFFTDVRREFDIVLVDCPPVLPVPDAMAIGSRVDGVVMIYKVGKTSRDTLRMAKSRLEHSGARIFGIVLNQIRAEEQVGASAYHFREYVDVNAAGRPVSRRPEA